MPCGSKMGGMILLERTASVQAIDLDKRMVTLKGEQDNVFDLKEGEEAKNLP